MLKQSGRDGHLDLETVKILRQKRFYEIKLNQILKEAIVYILFLLVLFVVTFSNLSQSSFVNMKLFQSTFVQSTSPNEIALDKVRMSKI